MPPTHAIGRLIHEGVSGSEMVTLPEVGHTLVLEQPAEFNRVVEDFLKLNHGERPPVAKRS